MVPLPPAKLLYVTPFIVAEVSCVPAALAVVAPPPRATELSRSATAPVPTAVAFTLLAVDLVPMASYKSPDTDLTPRATAPAPAFVTLYW